MNSIDNTLETAGRRDGFLQRGHAIGWNGVMVTVFPLKENMMRASHAILAIHQIAFQSVEESLFYFSRADLSVGGSQVGYVEIKKQTPSPRRLQTPEEKIAGNLTADEVAQSGTIDFPQARFRIPWKVVGGKVNSKAMFTAIIDGLVKIAQLDSVVSECDLLYGVGPPSSTGQVVITIGGDNGELDYGLVKISLLSIF